MGSLQSMAKTMPLTSFFMHQNRSINLELCIFMHYSLFFSHKPWLESDWCTGLVRIDEVLTFLKVISYNELSQKWYFLCRYGAGKRGYKYARHKKGLRLH